MADLMIQFLTRFPEYQGQQLESLPSNERRECGLKMLAFSVDAARTKVFDLDFLLYVATLGRNLEPMDMYIFKMMWAASNQWCFRLFTHDATSCDLDDQLVYFVGRGNAVKIGIAVNPKDRIRTLQIASPARLKLLATQEGGRKMELQLHDRFKSDHVMGEWFKMSDELKQYINSLAKLNRT